MPSSSVPRTCASFSAAFKQAYGGLLAQERAVITSMMYGFAPPDTHPEAPGWDAAIRWLERRERDAEREAARQLQLREEWPFPIRSGGSDEL